MLVIAVLGLFLGFLTLISKAGEWKGSVDTDRRAFNEFMNEIRDKLQSIFDRLPPSPLTSGSPLKLTDLGEQISSVLDGKTWAQDQATQFINQLAGKTKYEIQEMCMNYANNEFEPSDDSMGERIDDCAFNFGIRRTQVLEVLAIELRDELIRQLEPRT